MNRLDDSLLRDLLPFRGLTGPQLREILAAARTGHHAAGSAVFSEGWPIERFFLLLDGHIRVQRSTAGGDQVIVLHIVPGQMFGIGAALGHKTYPATAVAADDCIVLGWPNGLWPDFAQRYPGLAAQTYRLVGERLTELHSRVMEMATKQVEQRIASAILRLITQTGRKVDGGIEIDFPVTRQNISDMTGTTIHTVSRLLSGWERDGIVASERRKITVLAPHRLLLLSGAAG